MSPADLDTAAQTLADNRVQPAPLPLLPDALKPGGEPEAFRLQALLHERLSTDPRKSVVAELHVVAVDGFRHDAAGARVIDVHEFLHHLGGAADFVARSGPKAGGAPAHGLGSRPAYPADWAEDTAVKTFVFPYSRCRQSV